MNNKSIVFIVGILLSLMIVGCVSAQEDTNTTINEASATIEETNNMEQTLETPTSVASVDETTNETEQSSYDSNYTQNDLDYEGDVVLGESITQTPTLGEKHVSGNTFQDIQDAIDSASPGDTIFLDGRTYTGNGTEIIINKTLNIYGGFSVEDDNLATLNSNFKSRAISVNHTLPGGIVSIIGVYVKNGLSNNSKYFWENGGGIININVGYLYLSNSIFENNYASIRGGAIFTYCNSSTVIKNCVFKYNSAGNGVTGAGGVILIGQGSMFASIDNCTFSDNSVNSGGVGRDGHAGAVCANININITNCIFINNTASEGGAITPHKGGNIENCTFEGNNANVLYGGAFSMLAENDDLLNIINCTFKNNSAPSGGAIYILDNGYNLPTTIKNGVFDNNTATVGGGAIYIEGKNAKVSDSNFTNNTASLGAGVYILGSNNNIASSNFTGNDASNGGGIYIQGNNSVITDVNFYNNTAVISDDLGNGLGGGLYINGKDNQLNGAVFEGNVARNGSGIYNNGDNFTIKNTKLLENQAWSYLLNVTAKPSTSNYDSTPVTISVNYIAGDNIANAIYHNGTVDQINFDNVQYNSSSYGVRTTTASELHPVNGVENSNQGILLYLDSRVDNQVVNLTINNTSTGVVTNYSLRTDIYGNITEVLTKFDPGVYSVVAVHPEDSMYKAISNTTSFDIIPVVDVSVSKTSDKSVYVLGENVVYTIVVSNIGKNTAHNVTLKDLLPKELVFISSSAGGYDSDTGVLSIGNLTAGSSMSFTITAKTNAMGSITTYANVSCNDSETDYTNNKATNKIDVNINSTKSVDILNPVKNQIVTYNLSIQNIGNTVYADTITLNDYLSDGLTFIEVSGISGADLVGTTPSDGKIVFKIKNIVASGAAVISVKVRVNSDGTWPNTLELFDHHTIVNITTVDLKKEVNDKNPKVNEIIQYNLTIKNTGKTTINNTLNLVDSLPEGLEYAGKYDIIGGKEVSFTQNGNKLTWNVANIITTTPLVITVSVKVTKEGTWTNNLTLNGNYTVNETITTLKINKTTDNLNPVVNEIIYYNLTVINTGSITIDNTLNLVDSLPEGLEYAGKYSIAGGKVLDFTQVDNKLVWNVTNIAITTPLVITVGVKVTKEGTWTNNLTLNGKYTVNQTIGTVEPDKSVDNLNPVVGEVIKYNLTVVNTGDVTITNNVNLVDSLPDGLEYAGNYKIVGGKVLKFTQNGNKLVWNVTNIATTTPLVITVSVKVTKGGSWTNNLTLNGKYTVNQTIGTVEPKKSVDNLNPVVGEVIKYNLTVVNTGDVTITNVVDLVDSLPDGLEYAGKYSIVGGNVVDFTQVDNKLVWNVTNIATTTPLVITVGVKVIEDGTWTNNLTLNGGYTVNQTIITVDPYKTVDNLNPVVGEIIKYNLTVINTGEVTITNNLDLVDSLPIGLEYAGEYSIVGGDVVSFTQVGNKLVWSVTNITTSNPLVITVSVKVTKNGTLTNNFTVGNNSFIANQTITTVVPDKIVDNLNPVVGELIKYNLTVVNTGEIIINNTLNLVDSLPDGLEYAGNYVIIGGDVVDFTQVGNKLVWNVTNITTSTPLVITVGVKVVKDGTWINNLTLNGGYTVNQTVTTVVPDKSVDNLNPVVGEVIKYNLTVVNTGEITINNRLNLVDSLPEGLEYAGNYVIVGGNVLSFTQDGNKLVWSVTNITTSNQLVITVSVKVTKNGTLTNNFTVGNNSFIANQTITTVEPNKSVDNLNPVVGELIKYNLTVVNTGEITIDNTLNLVDSLPEGLEYAGNYEIVGGIVLSFTQDGNKLVWSVTNITTSNPLVITVGVKVIEDGTWINNLTLNGGYTVNQTINTVIPDKTVGNLNPVVGEIIKYNLTIMNTGEITINNTLNLVDSLPDGLEYAGNYEIVGGNVLSFTQVGNKLVWDVTNITTSNPLVITVSVKVTKDGSWMNNLTLNGGYTVNQTITTILPNKTVGDSNPEYGDLIVYNLTVRNTGELTIGDNITLVDYLPDGIVYAGNYTIKGANLVSFTINGKQLTWVITNISRDSSAVISVLANVTGTGLITNNLTVNGNYTVNNTIKVNIADLEVIITPSNYKPKYGEEIIWNITVVNNGPDTSKNVNLTEILPEDVIYVLHNTTKGLYNETTGLWTIGNLTDGESVVLLIKSKVNVTNKNITDFGVVNSTTYDPNLNNNKDNKTITVAPEADLEVIIIPSDDKPRNGDNVTWNITVINHGPDKAENVNLTEILPDGVIYVLHNTTKGTYNETTGLWTIGNLTDGETVVLTIVSVVNVTNTNITNGVVVNATTYDPNLINNKDNKTLSIAPEADLEVIITPSNDKPRNGEEIIWNITVINHGPDKSENVNLTDLIPDGVIYISHNTTKGNYNETSGLWTIGNLTDDETVVLIIKSKVNVTNTNITNTAVVNATTYDPNLINNKDNKTITVAPEADLELIKIVNVNRVQVGDTVIWTITVINHGPDNATNVKVFDSLPSSLKLVSFNVTQGEFANGIWYVGTLENSTNATLVLVTRALVAGITTNFANVTSDTYDPNMTSNEANATTEIEEIPNKENTPVVSKDTVLSYADNNVVASNNIAEESISEAVLPVTGNPLVLALLALFVILGIGYRKKQ